MPVRSTNQLSVFTPIFLDPDCVTEGIAPRMLWRQGGSLLPNWHAGEWRGHQTTTRPARRAAWPVRTLFALQVLRWAEYRYSRLGAC